MKSFLEKNIYEKRKGQAEIFGLIIIVILLIFALLFFVKTKQSDDSSVTLRSSFRANNLMNAIMDVNLGGNGNPSLKYLVKLYYQARNMNLLVQGVLMILIL